MVNFSPASATNPLKIKLSITNPSPVFQTRLGFSARPNGPENLKKSHVIETEIIQPGLKSELGHAQ